MMMLASLVGRSLIRRRGALAGLAVVLTGFQMLLAVIAASLHREGLFSQFAAIVPPFMQQALGGAVIASFRGMIAFGFFHPVVIFALTLAAIDLAAELAGDVEEGLVDLLAARPVPRHLLVTRSLLVSIAGTSSAVLVMFLGSRGAVRLLAPAGVAALSIEDHAWLAANLLAVVWCCGAAGLAVAAAVRRRSTATVSVGLAAVVMYLLHFAATSWAPARRYAVVSPFHYFEGMEIALGMADPRTDIVALVTATAVLAAAAYALYEHRDL